MQINISKNVIEKIYQYANAASQHMQSEIAGWAHYTPEKGIYKLAPLMEQTVHGSEVNQIEQTNDPNYDISDLCVQWHSHVNMGAFFSSPDEKNIEEMLKMFHMIISIVVNCKGDYKARMDIGRIKVLNQYVELEKPIKIDLSLNWMGTEIPESIMNEVKEKLKPIIYVVPSGAKRYEAKFPHSTGRWGEDLFKEWDEEFWFRQPETGKETPAKEQPKKEKPVYNLDIIEGILLLNHITVSRVGDAIVAEKNDKVAIINSKSVYIDGFHKDLQEFYKMFEVRIVGK